MSGAEAFRAVTQSRGSRNLREMQKIGGHYNPASTPFPELTPPPPPIDPKLQRKLSRRSFRRWLLGLLVLAFGVETLRVHSHNHSVDPEFNWPSAMFQALPMRFMSRLWGSVHNIDLPVWARAPLYNAWTYVFDCKLDEMRDPIDSYPNLAKFFTRHLKPGVRPISDNEIVSPVDGRVSVFGRLQDGDRLEQIKGMTYSLEKMIGRKPELADPKSNLYYAVFYLAPGDYHRIHAPTSFNVAERRHVPGEMWSVSPILAAYTPNLFVFNERVVLNGDWRHGFFSATSVAAYNVGSIKLAFDEDMTTNNVDLPTVPDPARYNRPPFLKRYTQDGEGGLPLSKAQEIARFELGSTVVLVFETKDAEFQFDLVPHQRVRMGEAFGRLVPRTPSPSPSQSPSLSSPPPPL